MVQFKHFASMARPKKNAAVKRISNVFDDFLITRRTLREIKLMRHFTHQNVIGIVDTFFQEAEKPDDEKIQRNAKMGYHYEKVDLYLLSELCDYDLDQMIRSRKQIDPRSIRSYTLQMLIGLKFLHKAHVVHRDLKPANIFVKRDGVLKLGDLGLARSVDLDDDGDCLYPCGENLTEYVVTRWYRAPEILILRGCYSPIIDIWSVGCILWEMFSRQCLLPGKGGYDQVQRILNVVGCHPDVSWLDNTIERQEQGLCQHGKATRIDDVAAKHACEVMRKISSDTVEKFPGVYNHLDQNTYPILQSSRYPFPGRNNFATCNLPDTGKHGQRLPSIYRDLIQKMLQFNPEVRITVDESLRHPLFQDLRSHIEKEEDDLASVKSIDMAYDMSYDPKASDSKNIPVEYRTDLREHLLEEMQSWKEEKAKRELREREQRERHRAEREYREHHRSEREQYERARDVLWSREQKRQRGDEKRIDEKRPTTAGESSILQEASYSAPNTAQSLSSAPQSLTQPSISQNIQMPQQQMQQQMSQQRKHSKRSADSAGSGGHVNNSMRSRRGIQQLHNVSLRAPQLLPFSTSHQTDRHQAGPTTQQSGPAATAAVTAGTDFRQADYSEDLYTRNLQNIQKFRYPERMHP